MRAFAALVTQLGYTRSRNAKVALIADYLRATPDPDRGWALAALTGEADFSAVKSSAVRAMAMERVDPELFRLSRDFVGDTAETVALIWPETGTPTNDLRLADAVDSFANVSRARAPALLAEYMDRLDSDGRYALIKLATGAMRVGISARLAKTAFAQAFGLDIDAVEEVWHALAPPYASLFAWGEGGPRPDPEGTPYFRPFMLAHPLEDGTVDLADYAAEWKWDGIRIQIVRIGEQVRLFSRGGDDITLAFPDIAQHMPVEGVFDGELLVRGQAQMGEAASFNALQQRLGRKTVSAKMLAEAPAFVRLYDLLIDGRETCAPHPGMSAGRGSRRSCRRSPPTGSTCRRSSRQRILPSSPHPRRRARCRDRGRDAQAARQPVRAWSPCRAVVQVEARPADRRLRDDVRAARQRQAVELL